MIAYPASIEQMYPQIPVALLLSDEWQQRFRQYFLESGEFDDDPFHVLAHTERPHKKCVSVCLFNQNADNRVRNEFPVNENLWHVKYWEGLLKVVGEMESFPAWKLRVYIERVLWDKVLAELGDHPQVELYRMAVNSVGASPGTLWRFMALSDHSLDVVLVTDIDESLATKENYIRSFEMDSRSAIGRIGGFSSDGKYIVAPRESSVKNYATMTASLIMSRPARFDFDLVATMRGFMAYRKFYSTSDRPWAYTNDEAPSDYNQPIGGMIYGWGSHWYVYGFDERFLKHVIYYHFAEKGALHTWALSLPPSQMEPEGICDVQHVRSKGNTIVYPHTAVHLEPLQLTPEALRVGFVLDEYRWIFESLLKLVNEHSDKGFRGNLFWNKPTDPYCLELVPKQLNLFQAARRTIKVLEIGFNAGHGAAVMMLANPDLKVRAFDNCELAYTKPCFNFLSSIFGSRLTLIEGQSRATLAADSECGYDLVHIDADHGYDTLVADLTNTLSKCIDGAVVVVDDHEGSNDIARATRQTTDLVATDAHTLRKVFPGSSYSIFHYRMDGQSG